jgi:hypothetical protein
MPRNVVVVPKPPSLAQVPKQRGGREDENNRVQIVIPDRNVNNGDFRNNQRSASRDLL